MRGISHKKRSHVNHEQESTKSAVRKQWQWGKHSCPAVQWSFFYSFAAVLIALSITGKVIILLLHILKSLGAPFQWTTTIFSNDDSDDDDDEG